MFRALLCFIACFCFSVGAAPPVPVPFVIQHDYDASTDLFGGGNYMTSDDNLILDSMTAAQGMSKLQRIETAKENLQKLLHPAALEQLRAPAEMQKQLYLVLFWLAQAYDAEASPQEMLEEVCRHGDDPPTAAQTTLQEVLLYNFHVAQHLGVISFQAQVKLGQGRPPVIPETDENPRNRLAFAIPILPRTLSPGRPPALQLRALRRSPPQGTPRQPRPEPDRVRTKTDFPRPPGPRCAQIPQPLARRRGNQRFQFLQNVERSPSGSGFHEG